MVSVGCEIATRLGRKDEIVAARGIEPGDVGEFGKPPLRAAPGKHSDNVDRFRDQGAWDGDDRFLDELLKPPQRAESGPGMDRPDAAGMSRSPSLQEV
jgi:hypothetical protein